MITNPSRIHPHFGDCLSFAKGVLTRIAETKAEGRRFINNDNVRWWGNGEWTSFVVHAVGTTFRFVDTELDVILNIQIDKQHLERGWYADPTEILAVIERIEPPRIIDGPLREFGTHVAAKAADDLRCLGMDPTGCHLHLHRPLTDDQKVHMLLMGPGGEIIEGIVPTPSLVETTRSIPPRVWTKLHEPHSPTGYRHSLGMLVSGETVEIPLDGFDALDSMRACAALPVGSGWGLTIGVDGDHRSGQESAT